MDTPSPEVFQVVVALQVARKHHRAVVTNAAVTVPGEEWEESRAQKRGCCEVSYSLLLTSDCRHQ